MAVKTRLDKYLSERGLSVSREKARSEIISGWVKVNGETVRDPARQVSGEESFTVARPGGLYVSRGGTKIDHALVFFGIDVNGLVAADLGASTGGFTDCLLKKGAKKVYSIDVGYGQLDYSLRINPAVVVMEKVNARFLKKGDFNDEIGFVSADMSFISAVKVFRNLSDVFTGALSLCLIKPQFEAEKKDIKKGVVSKPSSHIEILMKVVREFNAFSEIYGLTYSPIKGPKGNIEFFLYFKIGGKSLVLGELDIERIVRESVTRAHEKLSDE